MNPPPPMLPASGCTTASAKPDRDRGVDRVAALREDVPPDLAGDAGCPRPPSRLGPRSPAPLATRVHAGGPAAGRRRCSGAAGTGKRRERDERERRSATSARIPRRSGESSAGGCPGRSTASNLAAGWRRQHIFLSDCVADDFLRHAPDRAAQPPHAPPSTPPPRSRSWISSAPRTPTVPGAVARARERDRPRHRPDRGGVPRRRPAALRRRRHQRTARRARRRGVPADLRHAAGDGGGHHRRRASRRWSSRSKAPRTTSTPAIGEMDARRVGPDDVVVGIAASGTTPFVRAALGPGPGARRAHRARLLLRAAARCCATPATCASRCRSAPRWSPAPPG